MRRTQKKQVEDFIKLLEQAHTEIIKNIENNAVSTALLLIEQCQEGAIRIGTLIEKTESENCAVISLLEQYCELLYRIHEDIIQNKKEIKNPAKALKPMRQVLIQIENSARRDIKVRTEVVFLPYKASMWDSLESIWKAADEDENCDAIVIPIPYYDKNPDGSFKEMHYEAKLYPEYVPVVDYQSYNFEKRRPDIIFIHNPYDECNYVTSVPPFFFSKNLKQFTEKLVYIPYFILSERKPNNEKAVESMKHFCTVPGVIHADKVVVQSEDMRQIYINVLTEEMGKNTRKYWEDKILGIGSPKIDKILNTKKEDLEIPESWMRIIKKTDGSWKKVILYNTSVAALLKYGEKTLKKVDAIFQIFKENQNEIALLWRPHPLLMATIESMRPQLQTKYKQQIKKYKEAGWGIYDDSAELDRAIILSDAYYGDASSVVQLCRKMKKPIMIQEVEQNSYVRGEGIDREQKNTYNNRLSTNDFVIVGKNIYFFSLLYNGLYCLHMPQKQLEFLGSVPGEKFWKRHLYGSIVEVDGKLYMPPMAGEEIAIYDIKQRKFNKLPLRFNYKNIGSKFLGVLYDNRKIFFIPCWYPYLIVLDLDSECVTYLDEWYHMLNIPEKYEGMVIRNGFFIKDKILYMASMIDNSIIEISTENYKTKIARVGDGREGFIDMCFDEMEKCVWLLHRNRPIVEQWGLDTFKTRVYKVKVDSYKQMGEYPFINIICDCDRIYLISFQSNISVVLDKKDDSFFPVEWETDDSEEIYTEWEAKNYFAKKIGKNEIVIGTIGELSFCVIRQGKLIDKIYLNDPLLPHRYNCQRGEIFREDDKLDVRGFLEVLLSVCQKVHDKNNKEVSYGQEIHRVILKKDN